MEMVNVNKKYPDSIKNTIKFLRGNTIVFTSEYLKSENVPYIVSIPIYSEDYINEFKNLT